MNMKRVMCWILVAALTMGLVTTAIIMLVSA